MGLSKSEITGSLTPNTSLLQTPTGSLTLGGIPITPTEGKTYKMFTQLKLIKYLRSSN